MDRIPPLKSNSFSPATTRKEKLVRNLSLGAIKLSEPSEHIKEEARESDGHIDNAGGKTAIEDDGEKAGEAGGDKATEPDIVTLSAEIDVSLASRDGDAQVRISEVTLDRFAAAVEQEIAQWEGTNDKWVVNEAGELPPLLGAIKRIATLASALTANTEGTQYTIGVHRVISVLHHAKMFIEDEFHAMLKDIRIAKISHASDTGSTSSKSMRRPSSFRHASEPDRCVLPSLDSSAPGGEVSQPFPAKTVDRLRAMVDAMITVGYVKECMQVFLVASGNALDMTLQSLGYKKASINDVVKMSWEALQSEITMWIKAFQFDINVGLSTEHDLCTHVFAGGNDGIDRGIFADLACCSMHHMLNFTEAVAMTKSAAEKLFKVLDMYEAIRDATPIVDTFLSAMANGEASNNDSSSTDALTDLKSKLASMRSRLGESATANFCDLKSSIRAETSKQPALDGAVHLLTRYIMNYLKYACEYRNTLEQVFREHHRPDFDDAPGHDASIESNPFAAQLMEVMEVLHVNLEAKSRLYKDPSLCSTFLMNNERYMLQKIRGSPEINALVGEEWVQKWSTDLRQYHKNYQRETSMSLRSIFLTCMITKENFKK